MVITAPLPNLASPGYAVLIVSALLVLTYMTSPRYPNPNLHIPRGTSAMARPNTGPIPIIDHPSDTTIPLPVGAEGNLSLVSEEPVLEESANVYDQVDVMVNFRIARQPNGQNAIRVFMPKDGVLTAGQAHWLHIDLDAASQAVNNVRAPLGYES